MNLRAIFCTVGLILATAVFAAASGRHISGDYLMTVDGEAVDVIRVPMPEKSAGAVWNKLDWQPYSYAPFVATGTVEVCVRSGFLDLSKTEILPASKGVAAVSQTVDTVVFKMTPPMTLVLEPKGRHRALVVSANRPEDNPPRADDPKVKYFGPGVHRADAITLRDGETLYLAPGAWVEGWLNAKGRDITVCGSGVLSGAAFNWREGPKNELGANLSGQLATLAGENITVRDVTLFSSWGWTLVFNAVTNAVVDNVKVVCGRVINDDGIDICRAKDVVLRNSFVRCQDDAITPKWWCENLVCTNMTLWTDAANAFRIGYECESGASGLVYRNLLFKDIDVLHLSLNKTTVEKYWANCAIYIQAVNEQPLCDMVFDDLRFHECGPEDIFLNVKTMRVVKFYNFPEAGYIRGLALRNIHLPDSRGGMFVNFKTRDDAHPIEGVRFENVTGYGPVTKSGRVEFDENRPAAVSVSQADITDFGAREAAAPRENAAAIQRAIDAVAKSGGGCVSVPAGRFTIGTIWLKSNVELHLAEGACLVGSADLADYNADDAYPENWGSRSEGWQAKHLVIARDVENVAITGPGTIDGAGYAYFKPRAYRGASNYAWRHGYRNSADRKNAVRPGQCLVFVGCRNVRMSGLKLRDMPCWTCYFHGCETVRVDGCEIRTPMDCANTDGFDVDCCRDVVVANCDIETGDDCLTVRASAVQKLGRFARPCEDVLFSNCVCRCAATGVRIGVGTGEVRNVRIRDIDIRESGRGIVVQSTYPESKHPNGEGVTIHDLSFDRIRIRESGQAIVVTSGAPNTVATISDVAFRDLDMESSGAVIVEGCGVKPVENVSFDTMRFEVYARAYPYCKDWEVVGTNCDHEAAVWIDRAKNVRFERTDISFRHDCGDVRDTKYSVVDSENVVFPKAE